MSKKYIIALIFLILLVAGVLVFFYLKENYWVCQNGNWQKHGNPIYPMPSKSCPVSIVVSDFDECKAAGYPIFESYPAMCKTPDGKTFTENIGNELEKMNFIRITNPRPNDTINSPLQINGQARGTWYFEASFPVKLYDDAGNLLASTPAEAQGDWMTEDFVPFKAEVVFPETSAKKGFLILEKDNPSGLPQNADELKVPVKFGTGTETMEVKVYFGNNLLDPQVSCNKTFPIVRKIFKTQQVARAALEELLKGVTEQDKKEGFFTSINPGVQIQKLTIENGVAKVDFNEQLEYQVGGSCRVIAIRSEIIETLKQFPTVSDVVISINGRTDDILQP